MEMSGEEIIPATQKQTWDALNDPEILKACVPGCESIEKTGENEYLVLMTARIGPVSAKFKGKLAQIGSRLVDAAAKKLAVEFFNAFNAKVATLYPDHGSTGGSGGHDHHEHHDAHPGPVADHPDKPTVDDASLRWLAAGCLVVFAVSMMALF